MWRYGAGVRVLLKTVRYKDAQASWFMPTEEEAELREKSNEPGQVSLTRCSNGTPVGFVYTMKRILNQALARDPG